MRLRALTSAVSLTTGLALLGLVGQGCSVPSAPPATVKYALRSIYGLPLPTAQDVFWDTRGNKYEIEVRSASVTFNGDGTYNYIADNRRTFNDSTVELMPATRQGTWSRNDSAYVARFINKLGVPYAFEYVFSGNGRVVRSFEFNGWAYEWVRVESVP